MPSALARLRLLLAFFRIPFAGAGASSTGRFRGLWALADSLEESPYLQHWKEIHSVGLQTNTGDEF